MLRTAFHLDGKLGGYGSYFKPRVVHRCRRGAGRSRCGALLGPCRYPDWTVGIKLGRDRNGGYWLLDLVRGRANPGDLDRLLLNTATQDGKQVRIGFGKDPGQAGKSQALHLGRARSGFTPNRRQADLSRPLARPLYCQPPIYDRRCHALQPLLRAARIFDRGFCDALPRFSSVRLALFREYPPSPPSQVRVPPPQPTVSGS